MLAGLFFVTASFTALSSKVENAVEPDSVILARHIREVKIENAVEEFSEHSFNSHLTEAELDSILKENSIAIRDGKVYYAPDSSFKIFVVYGESCGAYCNPYDQSWIHFNDESQLVINHADFGGTNIEIYLIPDGKYLVIESYWGRPAGYYSITGHAARVISFQDHKMVTHPVFESDEEANDKLGYRQYQEHVIDSTEYLNYNIQTKQLSYQYGHDESVDFEGGKAYTVKGFFQFENGVFVEKEQIKSTYEVKQQ